MPIFRRRLRRLATSMLAYFKARPGLLLALGILAIATVVVASVVLVWRGPWWLDGEYLDSKALRGGSAALVTGFRTAVVQLLAIFGAGIALIFTAINYRLSRRGQVTERFTKALERLGSDEPYVRFGGVLALEQIINDAPEQAGHAVQVLNAFVRERAPKRPSQTQAVSRQAQIATARRAALLGVRTDSSEDPAALPDTPAADVQQALTTLVRTPRGDLGLELTKLHLRQAQLRGANLERAEFDAADLSGAQLDGAYLVCAQLKGADLSGAKIRGADLGSAQLDGADLSGAELDAANLVAAELGEARLSAAWLVKANLSKARLFGVDFSGAQLAAADLTTAFGLTVEQILSARFDEITKLPPKIAADPRVMARIAELKQE